MLNKIIFFALGGGVGAGITFLITKKHYEKKLLMEVDNRVNAEIAAYKNHCENKDGENSQKDISEDPKNLAAKSISKDKDELMDYVKKTAEDHKYVNYSDAPYDISKKPITVIPYSELPNGIEDDIVRLKYFADGTLTDSDDDPLTEKEIKSTCGYACLDFFGKDEEDPDVVYVHNAERDRYYEISMDSRNFEDLG